MYEYVTKAQVTSYKTYCQAVFRKLQRELKERYSITAHAVLIGSGARNLVVKDGNGVFDLDYNLVIANVPESFEDPKRLKETVRHMLDKLLGERLSCGWDSTSSITYLIHSMNGK